MSKEILFRAWSKKEKAWICGFNMINFHSIYNSGMEPSIQRYGKQWPLSEIEIVQNTGIKDKNGKEIYEGDIVAQYYSYNGTRTLDQIAEVVRESNTQWVWGGYRTIETALTWSEDTEIIGNIFENPELLK